MSAFSIAALSLGLLGSFHCIAMCGPIALALPMKRENVFSKILSVTMYNGGRLITYSALGLLFGLAGEGFSFFGWQQILSIVIGSAILLGILLPQKWISRIPFANALSPLFIRLKSKLSWLFSKKTYPAIFSIGLLNGLLPCGLVYMAIAGSLASGSLAGSVAFMFLFGLATFPVMLLLSFSKDLISLKLRGSINKFTPVAIAFVAALMILRGLNLGVPYLSPAFDKKTQAVNCCESGANEKNQCEKNCCHSH